jgi:hypothetical protein
MKLRVVLLANSIMYCSTSTGYTDIIFYKFYRFQFSSLIVLKFINASNGGNKILTHVSLY